MTGQAGLLELSPGSALLLGGREWTVSSVEAQYGRVCFARAGRNGGGAFRGWRTILTAGPFRTMMPRCRPGRPGSRWSWRT